MNRSRWQVDSGPDDGSMDLGCGGGGLVLLISLAVGVGVCIGWTGLLLSGRARGPGKAADQ